MVKETDKGDRQSAGGDVMAENVPESEWDVYHLREAIREMIAAEEHLVSGGKLDIAREIRDIRKKLEAFLVERLRK